MVKYLNPVIIGASSSRYLMIVSSFLFAIVALTAKYLALKMPASEVVFLRFSLGLLLAAPLCIQVLRVQPIGSYRLLFLRALSGGCAVLFYFAAIQDLPVSLATLLAHTSPLYALLLAAVFLKEYPNRRILVFAFFVLLGCVLIGIQEHQSAAAHAHTWRGIVLAVLTAMCSGASLVLMRALGKSDHPVTSFTALACGGILCALVQHALFEPLQASYIDWQFDLSAQIWGLVVLMAASSFFAQILIAQALFRLSAPVATLSAQMTVVFVFIFAWIFLHESISLTRMAGIVLTLLGVVGVQYFQRKNK